MMKLHGHPQKDVYATPAEWPKFQSQGHWPQPNPIDAGHVHIAVQFPLYAEITSYDTIDIPFTLMLHDIAGEIGIFSGPWFKSIKWDATGTSTPPKMRGTADGLEQWSGVVTLDFTLGDDGFLHIFKFPEHGWAEVRFFTRTTFDDGDIMDVVLVGAVYSMIDPSLPPKPPPEQGNPGVVVRSSVVVSRDGVVLAGEMVTEIDDYLPLLPITANWQLIGNAYNYTAPAGVEFPDGRFELRLDPDLHNGVRGTLQMLVQSSTKVFFGPVILDPGVMGVGAHKELMLWIQPKDGESVSSVVAFNVTVGEGTPEPTTCMDPAAINFGGLLPCRYVTPPTDTVIVPDVVGQMFDAAKATLQAAGLTTTNSLATNPAAAGTVLAQAPTAGSVVTTGTSVALIVSSGPVLPPVEVWTDAQAQTSSMGKARLLKPDGTSVELTVKP